MALLTLKPFSTEHLTAAVQLDQACLGGLWSLDGYRRELENSSSLLLVLTTSADGADPKGSAGEELLGMICAWQVLEEVHITLLAVHPDVQRQGLGQLLLFGLLQVARERGLERATLEVRPSNQAALALYQKLEFQVAGRRRQYYPDREDGLILWRAGLQDVSFALTLEHLNQALNLRLQTAGWTVDRNLKMSEIRTNTRPENF